jgi:hypothetical protein
MSTLQTTPQRRNRTSNRRGAKVLAVCTLAAIGLALLILVPTNQRATAPTTGSIAHEAALTAQTPAPAGCFRDPATHALTCSHTAPSPVANPAPAGYFRDPATHELLRLPTAQNRAGQHPANHSRGRIIP